MGGGVEAGGGCDSGGGGGHWDERVFAADVMMAMVMETMV